MELVEEGSDVEAEEEVSDNDEKVKRTGQVSNFYIVIKKGWLKSFIYYSLNVFSKIVNFALVKNVINYTVGRKVAEQITKNLMKAANVAIDKNFQTAAVNPIPYGGGQ